MIVIVTATAMTLVFMMMFMFFTTDSFIIFRNITIVILFHIYTSILEYMNNCSYIQIIKQRKRKEVLS